MIWYSILWQPRDFNNQNAFIELDGCPRFYLSDNGSPPSKNDLESKYLNLFIKEIFATVIFMQNENGLDIPTHYRNGIFMPKQNPSYDNWLKNQFLICEKEIERVKTRQELIQKNIFLEYSSKIIRHDMHSGINTYLPRGMEMLLQKLNTEIIKEKKLQPAITLLERGLKHTQKVYQGVYAFTNLVKENSQLDKTNFDLKSALIDYLLLTAYHDKVSILDNLPNIYANQSLMCTAIDNLIRNGLKYNDTRTIDKKVTIYMENKFLVIEDNGIGMTNEQFKKLSLPYKRGNTDEQGSGLGLNICVAIIEEHGYTIFSEKIESGTKIKIGGLV